LSKSDSALARYFRASAEIDNGQHEAALADLDEAVSSDDSLWVAHWLRGEASDGHRRYQAQVADWTAVIKQFPNAKNAYLWRAGALDYLGDSAAAVADLNKAISLGGDKDSEANLYFSRAEAYYGGLNLDRSKADFDQAIQRETHLPTYYSGRAAVLYLMGDTDGALADLTHVTELRSNDFYYLLWIYLAELRQGKNATSDLRDRVQGFDLSKWPGPVLSLLLGDITRDQIHPPADPHLWSADERKLGADCEIDFFLGEQALLKGEASKAKALFNDAIATGIKEYVEYRAAKFELEHMKP
jgi:lipoprotein NlpI